MSSVNKCIIVGNLGADPEIKSFSNGGKVANLRIATSESWKDKQTGEKKEKTEWHSVTLQGDGLVGVAERYLHKGSKVFVEGKLQTRKWQDQSGQDRYTTEVVVGVRGQLVMLDGPKQGGSGSTATDHHGSGRASGFGDGARGHAGGFGGGSSGGFGDDLDDDIPFVTRDSVW